MENLKIRVANEAESREAQELFFALGYSWCDIGKNILKTEYVDEFFIFAYKHSFSLTHLCDSSCFNGKIGFKEITLPELRDMVVLRRNDSSDANVYQGGEITCLYDLYLTSSNDLYFYHCGKNKWILSKLNGDEDYYKLLKPIEKKEMKEYLLKTNDGYKLITAENAEGEGVIEVPEGAIMLIKHPNGREVWSYSNSKVNPLNEILWKRETLNDKVASAEEYRQAEALPFIDDEPNQETIDAMDSEAEAESFATADELFASLEPLTNAEKYPHYFKSVKHLDEVDVYAVMDLFDVQNQAVGHAVKKLLVGGKRGAKDYLQDIREARDTLNRAIQIIESK